MFDSCRLRECKNKRNPLIVFWGVLDEFDVKVYFFPLYAQMK